MGSAAGFLDDDGGGGNDDDDRPQTLDLACKSGIYPGS